MPKIGESGKKPKSCAACSGTGRSSNNTECFPCQGTGVQGGKRKPKEKS